MNNQHNIRIVLSPISKILRFFGLNTGDLSGGVEYAIRICYSTCVSFYIIVQFLFNYRNIMSMNLKEDKQNLYLNVALFFLFGSETLSAISSITIGIFHYRKKVEVNTKLCKIEHLSSDFLSFDFSKFLPLQCIIRFAFILLSCCFLFDAVNLFFFQPRRKYFILMMHYSARFIFWIDISYFLVILKILRLYFDVINQELITMSKNFKQNVASEVHEFSKIKTMKRIHCSLKKVFRMQNCLYQWQLSFAVLHSVSAFTSYAFFFVKKNLNGLISFAELQFKILMFDIYGVFWISMNFTMHILILKNISDTLKEVR